MAFNLFCILSHFIKIFCIIFMQKCLVEIVFDEDFNLLKMAEFGVFYAIFVIIYANFVILMVW